MNAKKSCSYPWGHFNISLHGFWINQIDGNNIALINIIAWIFACNFNVKPIFTNLPPGQFTLFDVSVVSLNFVNFSEYKY